MIRRGPAISTRALAHRPEVLGEQPSEMTVTLSPYPTFAIAWRNAGSFLSVTQRRGGPRPAQPPMARQLEDVADSAWWMEDSRANLVLSRFDLGDAQRTELDHAWRRFGAASDPEDFCQSWLELQCRAITRNR